MPDRISERPHDDAPLTTSKWVGVVDATRTKIENRGETLFAKAVTINRPLPELFAYWRDFSNLAAFMENVERIDVLDQRRSHWSVKGPAGKTIEWDAVVTDEAPDSFIAWASAEGADVPNSGRVDFKDAGARGTVVTATILYDPPGGAIGKLIARMFQREPTIQVRRDLRRFKQLMETGEIATAAMNAKQFAEEQE